MTWPQRHERRGGVRRGLSDMREEEEFNAASVTHHARGGGVRRGLSDMSEEDEFDAASATCARRRLTLTLTLTSSTWPQRHARGGGVWTLPPRHERGGGDRCGLSDMREEEEFDTVEVHEGLRYRFKVQGT